MGGRRWRIHPASDQVAARGVRGRRAHARLGIQSEDGREHHGGPAVNRETPGRSGRQPLQASPQATGGGTMTPEDGVRFTAGVMALADLTQFTMTETLLGLYFKALADLSIEQFEAAVEILARTSCRYGMPKPVEIREAALGSPGDQAVLAWERVLTALRHHGRYVSVDFTDPVIHRVIADLGGWPKLCDLP